jgi:predicted ferric reductase
MLALNEKLAWYISRSSGIVAWIVVTASIVWGLALSSRLVRRRGVPAWLLDLHRYLGTLTIVFSLVHIGGLVADNYVYFGWAELFIPMYTKWRPGAAAWGIVAFYLIVAIQITSWMMRRMPRRIWHWIHLTSFPMFAMATVHGYQSGADSDNHLVRVLALVGMWLVISLIIFRLLTRKPKRGKASTGNAADEAVADSSLV